MESHFSDPRLCKPYTTRILRDRSIRNFVRSGDAPEHTLTLFRTVRLFTLQRPLPRFATILSAPFRVTLALA